MTSLMPPSVSGFLLTLVLMTSQTSSDLHPTGGSFQTPLTCRDGQIQCNMDSHCSLLLNSVRRECQMDQPCTEQKQKQCAGWQTYLRSTPIFRDCHCRVTTLQKADCMDIQRSIFDDYCGNGNIVQVHHAVNDTALRQEERDRIYEAYMEEAQDSSSQEEEADPGELMSCIGKRKRCLVVRECRDMLTDFRLHCRENKKRNECVSTDPESCFELIEKLKPWDVFNCGCSNLEKPKPKQRCSRIQWRLANNTCLVTVPYLIYSTKTLASSYPELISLLASTTTPPSFRRVNTWHQTHIPQESTCLAVFHACDRDTSCRHRLGTLMSSCVWDNQNHECGKQQCLSAIKDFYLYVTADRSHPLLFCQCVPGDYKCEAVRQSLHPACSTVENPPPACHHIIERCNMDTQCRENWHNYETYCHYDKITGGCTAGPAMCRSAQIGIMGTVLTTNCTCENTHDEYQHCTQARRRLHHHNVCMEMAIVDFNRQYRATTTHVTDHVAQHVTHPGQPWSEGNQHQQVERKDCLRLVGRNFPTYMSLPTVIRIYRNDSVCSDACRCLPNGTLTCSRLPCLSNTECRQEGMVYAHGSGFVRPDRGQCRCIKAEIICARPDRIPQKQRTGLFLHVGYSITEISLLEKNTILVFNYGHLTDRLADLLNKDSAEQFCELSLFFHDEGNIIFQITVSPHSHSPNIREVCETPTKTLSYMINSRHSAITTDAELSVLKVAEMELLVRTQLEMHADHKPRAPVGDNRGSPAMSSSSSSGGDTSVSSRSAASAAAPLSSLPVTAISGYKLLISGFEGLVSGIKGLISCSRSLTSCYGFYSSGQLTFFSLHLFSLDRLIFHLGNLQYWILASLPLLLSLH